MLADDTPDPCETGLIHCVADSFEEIVVNDEEKDVLVQFYTNYTSLVYHTYVLFDREK